MGKATARLKVNPPLGTRPSLEFRRIAELEIDPAYQRNIDAGPSQTLIRRIATFWDWTLCQPLSVAKRADGTLMVVDGQHRLEGARLRGDIIDLPCVISAYASMGEEAAAFVALNQQRRPLNRMQVFKAALAAGDKEALDIKDALDDAGLWIGSSSDLSIQKPGAIVCLRGLENCLHVHGKAVLAAALDVMAQSFKGQVLRYSGTIFPGIAALTADEMALDKGFHDGALFGLMTAMIGGAEQVEWYKDISARTAEIPTRRAAAIAVLRDAWAECKAE